MNEARKPTLDELKEQALLMEDPEARNGVLVALDGIERGRRILEESRQARNDRKAGETRGGAREGAGRPALHGERATEQISFRLTPTEKAALVTRYGKDDDTIHKVCARLVRQAMPPDEI